MLLGPGPPKRAMCDVTFITGWSGLGVCQLKALSLPRSHTLIHVNIERDQVMVGHMVYMEYMVSQKYVP